MTPRRKEPVSPLTPLCNKSDVLDERRTERYQGICPRPWVATTFRVPQLPDMNDFAYCVDSERGEWAYEAVRDAVGENTIQRKDLQGLKKGAVFEELFLF